MSISRLLFIALFLSLTACGDGGGDTPGKFGGGTDDDDDNEVVSGLDSRPSNTTCLATNFNQAAEIELTRIVPSLNFSLPILFLPHPADNNIFYVVQQRGIIWRVDVGAGTRSEVVDLEDYYNLNTCSECGLLGMAFDPDFANNRFIYLSFTHNVSSQITSFVARFTATTTDATALETDSGTLVRNDILSVAQPYDNHNGGHIAFGPDGFLYIGLGDGGSANDPPQNGQNINSLLGKILRVDTTGAAAAGNIFAMQAGDDRIFAYGLRNPWRWSFDRETGDLWLGDVGQNNYEEVDIIVNGGNYGWRCREGLHDNADVGNCTLTGGSHINPVAEYDHSEGISITGGYVYRGDGLPDYDGVYFFGDYGSGRIWGLFRHDNGEYERALLLDSNHNISSFGEGNDGELYLVAYGGGIYRIEEDSGSAPPNPVPESLSDTGCVDAADPTQPAPGLIPYAINEPFWSDGAYKERYMALPNGEQIEVASDGDFLFPTGTVLMKNFRLNDQLIETRLFMRGLIGGWQGYSYQWNGLQTAATLLVDDADVVFGSQTWHYPSSAECDQCHTGAANFSLGLETAQLNRNFTYPSTGRTANQLYTLEDIGVLPTLSSAVRNLRLRPSADDAQTLTNRARAYLHSNCAQCHRPEGGTPVDMDLRFNIDFDDMNICDIAPQDDLGIIGARRLFPGDHALSMLWHRMEATDSNRMPPTSSNVVDQAGADMIRNWINSLSTCTP